MMTTSLFRRPGNLIRFENTNGEFGACDGEIARVYSPSGELLREYRGFCDMDVPDKDRLLIERGILTCSHPLDTSFSRRDLIFASDFCLAEIRVFGKAMVYSMKPPGADWPDIDLLGRKYDAIRNSREFESYIADLKKSPEFLAKSKDPEMDLYRIRRDLICRRLADDFGMHYQKASYASAFSSYALHPLHFGAYFPAARGDRYFQNWSYPYRESQDIREE